MTLSLGMSAQDVVPNAMHIKFHDKATAKPTTISKESPEGTVGMLHGREAMVVSLGSGIGYVAIATSNIGADASNGYRGTYFNNDNYDDPKVNGLTDGWHIPTYNEMQAIINRLGWTTNMTGPWAGVKNGAEVYFASGSLLFPCTGRMGTDSYNNNVLCWCERVGQYPQMFMYNEYVKRINTIYGDEEWGVPIRPICALPEQLEMTAPAETEHYLEVSKMTRTDDANNVILTVAGKSVTYPIDMIDEITFFEGTPSVQIATTQDPSRAGKYYSTFYSSLEAYSIPDDVTAYTATLEGEKVKLNEMKDDILPRGQAVVLYSDSPSDIVMESLSQNAGTLSKDNKLEGVDVSTKQGKDKYYTLTYGEKNIGFYKLDSKEMLAPNEAFIQLPNYESITVLPVDMPLDIATDLDDMPDFMLLSGDQQRIYSVSGIQVGTLEDISKLAPGIYIVNGRKFVKK